MCVASPLAASGWRDSSRTGGIVGVLWPGSCPNNSEKAPQVDDKGKDINQFTVGDWGPVDKPIRILVKPGAPWTTGTVRDTACHRHQLNFSLDHLVLQISRSDSLYRNQTLWRRICYDERMGSCQSREFRPLGTVGSGINGALNGTSGTGRHWALTPTTQLSCQTGLVTRRCRLR